MPSVVDDTSTIDLASICSGTHYTIPCYNPAMATPESRAPRCDYVSLKHIAARAGVSVSTVSLALRNRPKVSEKERVRISRIARQLGYRPDANIARLMVTLRAAHPYRKASRLAFVVPGYPRGTDRKIEQMLVGARTRAAEYGYAIDEFWPKSPPGVSSCRLREILLTRGIEGILIGPMARGDDLWDFDFTDFCATALGYSLRTPNLHRAVPHHFKMMCGLLDELFIRGFRRLGLVLWERMEAGFNHLLSAAYFQMQQRLSRADRLEVLYADTALSRMALSPGAFERWLERESPDLVLGPGDVHSMLLGLGYRVPEDVSFASLDLGDAPYEAAGLHGRYDLVGAAATDLVVSQLNLNLRGVPREPKIVMVDSSWSLGPTVGQPRANRRTVKTASR